MTHIASYWIQSSDFSHQDYPAADAQEITRALEAHDWAAEHERRRSLVDAGKEECPAGLGVMAADERRLIIRLDENLCCVVEYSFFDKGKAFGILPKRTYHCGELENVPLEVAASFVGPFLANDYAAVKTEIESRA
ncbi:MAG: hypothetical protein HKN14_03610 [Marinicaulis sp.]|nr:hypothetical protein [Marinicaulis sp.]NNE39990.1 hypothetical protein [Marinicaulis sp.]NNL89591.1 hypothetical protein [Marinicaulis sp.]